MPILFVFKANAMDSPPQKKILKNCVTLVHFASFSI